MEKLIHTAISMFREEFGNKPKIRSFNTMTSSDQESLMRCNIERRQYNIYDDVDKLIVMVQCLRIIALIKTMRETLNSTTRLCDLDAVPRGVQSNFLELTEWA